MAIITISSQIYKQQLIDLYYSDIREFATSAGECGGTFFVAIAREKFDAYKLCELFEDIAIIKNDALTTCLPKLYEFVREAAFGADRISMVQGLTRYFAQNTELCVEGYMNFRLSNIDNMVDTALYALLRRHMQLG